MAAFYRGLMVKFADNIAGKFAYFYLFSYLRNAATRVQNGGKLSTAVELAIGYVAAVGNLLLTHPLDVVCVPRTMPNPFGRLRPRPHPHAHACACTRTPTHVSRQQQLCNYVSFRWRGLDCSRTPPKPVVLMPPATDVPVKTNRAY